MTESIREQWAPADVAAWLREHPTFFLHHPEVALAIDLPRENGQATSLASYQLEVLREKNRELNRRLQELFAVANENERLTVRTHQFTLGLLRAQGMEETLKAVIAAMREDFDSEWVQVVLFEPVTGIPDSPHWRVLDRADPQLLTFADFFDSDEPLCGRLQRQKLDLLFGADADQVMSSLLLSLGSHGMLAIGSADANRFYPGMGTFFVRLMAEALVAALTRPAA